MVVPRSGRSGRRLIWLLLTSVTAHATVGVGRCFQLVVRRLLQGDQRVVSLRRRSKDLIELALGGFLGAGLGVLDDEDHRQRRCRCQCLEHGLQAGREPEYGTPENPHHDGDDHPERNRRPPRQPVQDVKDSAARVPLFGPLPRTVPHCLSPSLNCASCRAAEPVAGFQHDRTMVSEDALRSSLAPLYVKRLSEGLEAEQSALAVVKDWLFRVLIGRA